MDSVFNNYINKRSTTDAPLAGMTAVGNIPLGGRPMVPIPGQLDQYGTIRSMGAGFSDGEYLIPTIYDGKLNHEEEAIARFLQTGKNLGRFDTPENAQRAGSYFSKVQGKDYSRF